MLDTLDTVIAFAVIMTVLSLLITLVVQMVSATLSLRGKNLANALALTFQTIDPSIGKYAHSLAAQILRDPIFSDSLWQQKTRRSLDENAQKFIAAQRRLRDAKLRRSDDPNRAEAINRATSEVNTTRAAVTIPNVAPNREKPWGFWTVPWGGSMEIATAIRPGEIYRVLQELREMSPEEAQLLNIPKELTDKARGLVAALHRLDLPALESRVKLKDIAAVANMFAPEQQKAVVETLGTFGATVERATTQAYDRFQRWFGSAQDRAEQWFQIHVRLVTIVAAILVSILLQLDTVEIYDKLRHEPKLVEALVKTAPGTVQQGASVQGQLDTDAQQKAFADLTTNINSTGFELVPNGWFARWPAEKRWWYNHLFGLALSAGLLTLGAPFWFNLLKNLMNLRPAVASLVEKRPTSAPALPASPATPPSPS
ncbi:MAG TPA: hypothetical protein VL136_09010 [Candidatus Babeliales bacterium]|nr:hypothetical protein [Candidatus Babeliales bacterium]